MRKQQQQQEGKTFSDARKIKVFNTKKKNFSLFIFVVVATAAKRFHRLPLPFCLP